MSELDGTCLCARCNPGKLETDCCGALLFADEAQQIGCEIWCSLCAERAQQLVHCAQTLCAVTQQDSGQLLELALYYNLQSHIKAAKVSVLSKCVKE